MISNQQGPDAKDIPKPQDGACYQWPQGPHWESLIFMMDCVQWKIVKHDLGSIASKYFNIISSLAGISRDMSTRLRVCCVLEKMGRYDNSNKCLTNGFFPPSQDVKGPEPTWMDRSSSSKLGMECISYRQDFSKVLLNFPEFVDFV